MLSTFIPKSDANEWRWVKTLVGTGDLPIRRGFAPPGEADDIMDGDVLVYRGDLIFGPVGYETNNVFLHAYLESLIPACPQPHYPILVPTADNNAVIEDPFCFVWNYTFTDKGAMAMRRHLNKLHRFRFQHPPHPVMP
ncbi:hypothetical protein PC128_g23103 [Phytophthora cactorum]|nr:hypothetical protein PC128_g23103 [Phytophthora cactorum]KAG4040831.1 hypothetical protein PC123_g23637 [Phytophthora cactorum]